MRTRMKVARSIVKSAVRKKAVLTSSPCCSATMSRSPIATSDEPPSPSLLRMCAHRPALIITSSSSESSPISRSSSGGSTSRALLRPTALIARHARPKNMKSITESWPCRSSSRVCTIDGWSDETYISLTSKFHIESAAGCATTPSTDTISLSGRVAPPLIWRSSTMRTPSSPDGPHV